MQKFKAGDVVRFANSKLHEASPAWYPPPGTEGEVMAAGKDALLVKWQEGTSKDKRCICLTEDIERP